ncbi:helix-turn-helix transcriptional regulator [Clostridiaceae bacterium M8S5]|nr:helix-turn-helix transcriptional regulator [Clostridiaceae bacterium M8S5]
MYIEIKPIRELRKHIESYWVISDVKENTTISVEPDGCFDIVVDIYIYKDINTVTLSGIWDEIVKIDLLKDIKTVGVRFYPNSLDVFFNLTLAEIKNTTTKYKIGMLKNNDLLDIGILYTSNDIHEIISFYDIYFLSLINEFKANSPFSFVHEIDTNSGVKQLADKIPMSTRQLNRLFQQKFGVTTKRYINIIRFIKAKKMLIEGENNIKIAHECGYYDQSHFIKEFKKYTQKKPTEYLKSRKLGN